MNILTTSQKSNEAIQEEAKVLASSMHMTYIKRGKTSIPALFGKYQCEYIAVLAGSGLTIHFPENQQHTFHLSMAQLRILRLQRGEGDHLVNAVQVILDKKGLSNRDKFTFLDCTIGLGSDSIVVSYGCPQAQITGLEGSLPIWLATSHGLAHYIHSEDSVTNALRRIKINHDTFEHYLPNLSDNSIDIIYFDPMFEVPVEESPQFKPLRGGHTVESHIDDKIMHRLCVLPRMVLLLKNDHLVRSFKTIHPPINGWAENIVV
ncbi:class I SAM-dependent methyltransferase [Veillonella rogosae]|uniref:class I SAM-dependent methyltransferase n=1 Tax=Veillonella rogosae TaxID=423477 RepID=UPI000AFA1867|nr:class I SAM-dependent methyltransferase [Veillonella rogosae]